MDVGENQGIATLCAAALKESTENITEEPTDNDPAKLLLQVKTEICQDEVISQGGHQEAERLLSNSVLTSVTPVSTVTASALAKDLGIGSLSTANVENKDLIGSLDKVSRIKVEPTEEDDVIVEVGRVKQEQSWDETIGQPVFPEPTRLDSGLSHYIDKHTKQLGKSKLVVKIKRIDANQVINSLKKKNKQIEGNGKASGKKQDVKVDKVPKKRGRKKKVLVEADVDFNPVTHTVVKDTPRITRKPRSPVKLKEPMSLHCKKCNLDFSKKREYNRHMKMHEEEEPDVPVMCDMCSKILPSQKKLLRHQWYHRRSPKPPSYTSPGVIKTCHFCGKTFNKASNFQDHLRTHTGERPFTCNICNKAFGRKPDLYRHSRVHTGERPFACNECDATYTTPRNLRLHKLRLHCAPEDRPIEAPVMCETCGESFSNSTKLRTHHRAVHGEEDRKFRCDICGKCFSSYGTLYKHKRRVHLKLKPCKCDQCGKAFVDNYRLKMHQNTHRGEKPHVCDHCGRGFGFKNDLILHIRTHTGEKPFSCAICEHRFTTKRLLQRHKYTHTGEKPHPCELCTKRFTTSTQLKAHMITHTRERPFKCEVCGQGFTTRSIMKQHEAKAHSFNRNLTFPGRRQYRPRQEKSTVAESTTNFPMFFLPVLEASNPLSQVNYRGAPLDVTSIAPRQQANVADNDQVQWQAA